MSIFTRGWDWLIGDRAAGGPVGGKLAKELAVEPPRDDRDPSQATPMEHVAGSVAAATALKLDEKAEPYLLAAVNGLREAAGKVKIVLDDATRFWSEDLQRARIARLAEKLARQDRALSGRIVASRPLVSDRLLAIGESVLLVVEVFFWYLVFSSNIDRRVTLWDPQRFPAYGLAIFIPMLALFAARFAGPVWQRWWRHPADDRVGRRDQHAAALAGILLVGVSLVATAVLVNWRYSDGTSGNAFVHLPPSWAMALIFTAVVLVDAAMRTFSHSEEHETAVARDVQVAADKADEKRITDAVVTAKVGWGHSASALRMRINTGLDEIERVMLTAERLVLTARSAQPALHFTELRADEGDGSAADEARTRWHLAVELITVGLRNHATALQALEQYAPPIVAPGKAALDAGDSITADRILELDARLTALLDGAAEPEPHLPTEEPASTEPLSGLDFPAPGPDVQVNGFRHTASQ